MRLRISAKASCSIAAIAATHGSKLSSSLDVVGAQVCQAGATALKFIRYGLRDLGEVNHGAVVRYIPDVSFVHTSLQFCGCSPYKGTCFDSLFNDGV